jgi:hypothetical protein
MAIRSGLRTRRNVERIGDEGVDRVGDKQTAYDNAEKYSDVPERLIGWLCQGICSESDVFT